MTNPNIPSSPTSRPERLRHMRAIAAIGAIGFRIEQGPNAGTPEVFNNTTETISDNPVYPTQPGLMPSSSR